MLFESGTLQACWRFGLGRQPYGAKTLEGDRKTPEGWYRTSDKPWPSFDHAIAVHYPNDHDAELARRAGRITRKQYAAMKRANLCGSVPPQRTAMGGAILIHGGGSDSDWTLGCLALANRDLQDLRSRLPDGKRTHILILPHAESHAP